MVKKIRLKSYHPHSDEWKKIKETFYNDIGKDKWTLTVGYFDFQVGDDKFSEFLIFDYNPEKHDSIINELISRYG